MASILLAVWHFEASRDCAALVVPDGCRDLILVRPARERPFWFVSSLADHTYPVPVGRGDVLTGYRLKPGTTIRESALLAALDGADLAHDVVVSTENSARTLTVPAKASGDVTC